MTKQDIFEYFYTNSASLSSKDIFFTMLAGLGIGLIVYATYCITYRGVAYNRKFNLSLVVTLLIAVVIMLMISSNIVLSLGMVGALSIVRFRTAIKDSRDTIFLFWAIAEGLSVGSRNLKLALVTSLFIAVVFVAESLIPTWHNKYMLIITGGADLLDADALSVALKPYVKASKLRSANRSEGHQEYIFEVRTRQEITLGLADALRAVPGVATVNWVAESGETVG
jgi:c-di-AMP phosphodiesterase-like protein